LVLDLSLLFHVLTLILHSMVVFVKDKSAVIWEGGSFGQFGAGIHSIGKRVIPRKLKS